MIETFCAWLAATSLSHLFQELPWFVPLVQTIHILCIALMLFSIAKLDFRLMGWSADEPLSQMASLSLPWVWRALLILLGTGVLLTITEPERELLNNSFRLKMLLVLALAAITFIFQRGLKHDPQYWNTSTSRLFAGRALAAMSLLLGVSIVVAGRWIAYT